MECLFRIQLFILTLIVMVLVVNPEQLTAVIICLTGLGKLVLIQNIELRDEVDSTKKNKIAIKKFV